MRKSKILAISLVLMIIVSLLPINAFAEEIKFGKDEVNTYEIDLEIYRYMEGQVYEKLSERYLNQDKITDSNIPNIKVEPVLYVKDSQKPDEHEAVFEVNLEAMPEGVEEFEVPVFFEVAPENEILGFEYLKNNIVYIPKGTNLNLAIISVRFSEENKQKDGTYRALRRVYWKPNQKGEMYVMANMLTPHMMYRITGDKDFQEIYELDYHDNWIKYVIE